MLVLSRRPGEEIIINNNVRVVIVSVKGDRIRLGVDASPDIPVDRQEVHAAKGKRIRSRPVEQSEN